MCHREVQTDPVQIFPAESSIYVLEPGTQILLSKQASYPAVDDDHCYSMKRPDDISADAVVTSTPVINNPPKDFLHPCSPVPSSSKGLQLCSTQSTDIHIETSSESSDMYVDTDSAEEPTKLEEKLDGSFLNGSGDSNESSMDDDNGEFWTQVQCRKFIVFEESIDKLVSLTVCSQCKSPVHKTRTVISGTNILIYIEYLCNHNEVTWSGQAFIGKGNGKIASGNLLLSAATLYSGLTYTRVKKLADLINVAFISESTFYGFQRDILLPVINERWVAERQRLVDEAQVSSEKLTLGGDGRCDSPGFCAKYCTYSFMDSKTEKILDFELVQVTQTGTSQSMEKYGFCKVLDRLLEEGVPVGTVATDRHVGIRAVIKKDYSGRGIDHQFDVFHIVNSIRKKLKELTKKKKHADLAPWVRSILNHVWFSSRNCEGNPDKLVELFTSVIYHVAGIHRWSGSTFVNQCPHKPLTKEEQQERLWLKGPSLLALKDIVLEPKLVRDIRQLSLFCHTGKLETFHSKLLVFCPKRQEFDFQCMLGRNQLAVLDHNANVGREQAVVLAENSTSASVGESRFRMEYKKHSGAYHARPTYVATSQDHLQGLVQRALEVRSRRVALPLAPKPGAKNISMKPAPSKQELIHKQTSRF